MELRRTPLYQRHVDISGRMVPYSGWEMPLQYSSIIKEHMAVRKKAGLFDVSHMGEISLRGENAERILDSITCNHVSGMTAGQVRYNAILSKDGGVIDDLTIYKVDSIDYFIVANAANREAVYTRLKEAASVDAEVEDQSDNWHLIAIQGPQAQTILAEVLGENACEIAYFRFHDFKTKNNSSIRISRTGYTGEDGFELYSDNTIGVSLWDELMRAGEKHGLLPVGLAARDSLRLEALYPLYGHELRLDWTPVESGIGWIVKEKPGAYPGYDRMIEQKTNGSETIVRGIILQERGIPREGYPIYRVQDGEAVGEVLSGGYSPVLEKGIGTAMLPTSIAEDDTQIYIGIRSTRLPARVHKGPFVRGGAGRKKSS